MRSNIEKEGASSRSQGLTLLVKGRDEDQGLSPVSALCITLQWTFSFSKVNALFVCSVFVCYLYLCRVPSFPSMKLSELGVSL